MDAKSKANFINAVAKGEVVPCPNCNAANEPGSKFCSFCGKEMTAIGEKVEEVKTLEEQVEEAKTEEFKTVEETVVEKEKTPAFGAVLETPETVAKTTYTEEVLVFAEGLPSWDIVPPQIMVRRH